MATKKQVDDPANGSQATSDPPPSKSAEVPSGEKSANSLSKESISVGSSESLTEPAFSAESALSDESTTSKSSAKPSPRRKKRRRTTKKEKRLIGRIQGQSSREDREVMRRLPDPDCQTAYEIRDSSEKDVQTAFEIAEANKSTTSESSTDSDPKTQPAKTDSSAKKQTSTDPKP